MRSLRPHLILHGGLVRTLDEDSPLCEALAISGETILATGASHEILPLATGSTSIVDLAGGVVLPGLTDAHIHLELYARSLQLVDCEVDALDACLQRVEDRARAQPPGAWILGHGWNQNRWGRFPTRQELDAVCPAQPAYLTAKSLHAAWVNTAALRLAGIDSATPDPPGGVIDRAPDGSPSGVLLEAAMQLVADRVPHPDSDSLLAMMRTAQAQLVRLGLTGVHDFDGPRCFEALQCLRAQDELDLRVIKHLQAASLSPAIALGLRSGLGDDWLKVGNLKLFADGALGPRTAAMIEPYDGEPENRGQLLLDAEAVTEVGLRARRAGIGLAVHAIGDLANHHVLDAFERLAQAGPAPALPYRIEHLQVLHPDDFGRLANRGIVASMQPIHAPSDAAMATRYWGRRVEYAYAWRTIAATGAPLAFGSDAPVESPNPFWGLHAATTRRAADSSDQAWHAEQRLTLDEAVRAYTLGPAHAAGSASRLGRLKPGYLADLLVLEEDPWQAHPEQLRDFLPRAVLVGGRWRYGAG